MGKYQKMYALVPQHFSCKITMLTWDTKRNFRWSLSFVFLSPVKLNKTMCFLPRNMKYGLWFINFYYLEKECHTFGCPRGTHKFYFFFINLFMFDPGITKMQGLKTSFPKISKLEAEIYLHYVDELNFF